MHKLYKGLVTYSILICLTKQDKHFLIHFLSKFNKNFNSFVVGWCSIVAFIFLLIATFDILSHLANRETTDGRNIHACSTVDLFQYTCIFLSKVRILLDFRFPIKWVYLLCKFQEFQTLKYIFQDHLVISHCE
jgi:hypothetical protein